MNLPQQKRRTKHALDMGETLHVLVHYKYLVSPSWRGSRLQIKHQQGFVKMNKLRP